MLKNNIEMPHKDTNMNFIIIKTGNAIKALKNNILITEKTDDFKYKFRMFDDDGYLYFEGLSKKNNSFIPLDEFGNSYGCTEIHYLKNNSYQRL